MAEYPWEATEPNFEITNPRIGSRLPAPATDVPSEIAGKQITEYFEAVTPGPPTVQLSPEATASRGGAFQSSYTLNGKNISYNHDGLGFIGLYVNFAQAAAADAEREGESFSQKITKITKTILRCKAPTPGATSL